MLRSLIATLMLTSAMAPANSQQPTTSGSQGSQHSTPATPNDAVFPSKPETLHRIDLYEAAIQQATPSHLSDERLSKLYLELGGLYGDVAMYPKAEDALRHAVALLRNGPQSELASALGHLAVLHIAMGELHEAEQDQLEALRIRERVGDPTATAETWNDLADIYIKQRQFKKAVDYAQRAMPVLADNPTVDVAARIAVRQTLAYALCGIHTCGRAIPMLEDAIELAKNGYGADSLQVGVGYYLLGYASWQNGDMAGAAQWMARGTARMKVDLGWGHPVYVNSMANYARFLREHGQTEAAAAAQREVYQAQSVVDARSLTSRPTDPVAAALR